MSHWAPSGAPVGDVRSVSEYTDGELAACLRYADAMLLDMPQDSKWWPRVQEWQLQMLAEKDKRQQERRLAPRMRRPATAEG